MSEEEDKYKEKLHLLALRCEAVQRENEEIARQIVKSKRNLCKARRLRMRLLQKLDTIGDGWRHGQVKGISFPKSQSLNASSNPSTVGTMNTHHHHQHHFNIATNKNCSSSSTSSDVSNAHVMVCTTSGSIMTSSQQSLQPTLTSANLPPNDSSSANDLLSANNSIQDEDFTSSPAETAAALVSSLTNMTMPLTLPIHGSPTSSPFGEHDLMSSCLDEPLTLNDSHNARVSNNSNANTSSQSISS